MIGFGIIQWVGIWIRKRQWGVVELSVIGVSRTGVSREGVSRDEVAAIIVDREHLVRIVQRECGCVSGL